MRGFDNQEWSNCVLAPSVLWGPTDSASLVARRRTAGRSQLERLASALIFPALSNGPLLLNSIILTPRFSRHLIFKSRHFPSGAQWFCMRPRLLKNAMVTTSLATITTNPDAIFVCIDGHFCSQRLRYTDVPTIRTAVPLWATGYHDQEWAPSTRKLGRLSADVGPIRRRVKLLGYQN
jgi:hypothetical protein